MIMTSTRSPHLRHEHHHQVKHENPKNQSSVSYNFRQNFNNNLTSVPMNFWGTELDEVHETFPTESYGPPLTANPTDESNVSFSTESKDQIDLSLLYSRVVPPMLFFCVLTVLVNLVIVISARWCRKPMSPTLYFSISLALADAYTSLILGTGLLLNSFLPKVYGIKFSDCVSLTIEGFRLGGILVTVAHLLALAVNHWIGILRPLHYAATMTRRTAWAIILASWSCPILIIFLYFTSQSGSGFLSEQCQEWQFLTRTKFRYTFSSFFFIPLLLMSFIYIHIFFIVRSHNQERLRYQESSQQLKRNIKAVVTTVLILGTYILGWMPAVLMSILVCQDCQIHINDVSPNFKVPFIIVTNVLLILKTLLDPIIYAARMADIKLALKKMRVEIFSRCCGRCMPTSSVLDPLERASSKFERSMNETKSLRVSSCGSGSSSRRVLATGLNANYTPVSTRSHATSNSSLRAPTGVANGNHNKFELTELKQ